MIAFVVRRFWEPPAAMGNVKCAIVLVHFFLFLRTLDTPLFFFFFFFWWRFLFVGSLRLALLQPAIRTRKVSVPGDNSKSVKRNETRPIYSAGSDKLTQAGGRARAAPKVFLFSS